MIVLALGGITVSSAFLFKIDEVVSVSGKLESILGTVDVKTPAGGKISKVLFKDGDTVTKGQLLVVFDTTQARDDVETYNRLIQLETEEREKSLQMLDISFDVLQQKLKTMNNISSELRTLVDTGGFQRLEYLQQLDRVHELEGQLTNLNLEKSRLISTSEKNIQQMVKNLKSAELQIKYQNVLAPTSGVIFNPQVRRDSVINPGSTILTLVPQTGLQAEVFVSNKDIGFVRKGQLSKVRVDAFPFTRYGELTGEVSRIGADSLEPDQSAPFFRYPVTLKLNRSFLKSGSTIIPLRNGMSVTANLKLREKRVISLLSDMLVNQTEAIKSIRQF